MTMELAVVAAAQRHRKFVAGLASECAALREAYVVRIRRLASADQAGLLGNEPHVGLVANPARLWKRQFALVDRVEVGGRSSSGKGRFVYGDRPRLRGEGLRYRRTVVGERQHLRLKGIFNAPRIPCGQAILGRQGTVGPQRSGIGRVRDDQVRPTADRLRLSTGVAAALVLAQSGQVCRSDELRFLSR